MINNRVAAVTVIVFGLFAVVSGWVLIYGRPTVGRHLPYYNNSARARTLRVGMTRADVTALLGDPENESDGKLSFFPSPDGRTIRVELDAAGRVRKFDPGVD